MKTKLFVSLAACLLAVTSCQKNNVEPEGAFPANSSSAIGIPTGPVCDVINFENASGFLTSVTSAGGAGPITMTSRSGNSEAVDEPARVFDSSLPHPEDVDLGTPNKAYNGPGVGAGGAGGTYKNDTSLGNILVIQNPAHGEPNDDDVVGQFTFDFSSIGQITATSLTVIDVETNKEDETGSVKLYSSNGGTLLGTFGFPDTGANGVGVINLGNTAGVGYIVVDLDGSIGIDNLAFCRPGRSQCTYTQGYWKNHPEAWPVKSLLLGTVSYTNAQLLAILKTPVRGNGLISLAHQLIAAKLNVANTSDGSAVAKAITAADVLIGDKNVLTNSVPTSLTSSLTSTLDAYNNGRIGPGHCE